MDVIYHKKVAKILDKATNKEGTVRRFVYSSKLKVNNYSMYFKNDKI
jgi:hypothetical protein